MVPASARSLASSGTCYLDTDRHAPYEPLQMMKAIHVENFGGPEVLQLKNNLIIPPLTKSQDPMLLGLWKKLGRMFMILKSVREFSSPEETLELTLNSLSPSPFASFRCIQD